MTDSNRRRPAISRRDLLRTAGAAGAAALVPSAVGAVREETPETSSTASPGAGPVAGTRAKAGAVSLACPQPAAGIT